MDRIEGLLHQLIACHDEAVYARLMGQEEKRIEFNREFTATRIQIATDFRAMVAALDNALWLLGTDEDRRNIGDLHLSSVYRIPGMLRTTLARVKGE